MSHTFPQQRVQEMAAEENMFADLKTNVNRGSGSSNTTKTASTDASSRHSNVSTAPSSADLGSQQGQQAQHMQQPQEEWRSSNGKKPYAEIPIPPIPKNTSSGFLNKAGRTFSFGSQKKTLPSPPSPHDAIPPLPAIPPTPARTPSDDYSGRNRAMTSSTTSTATPPKLDDQDFSLDLGGDFGTMFTGSGFDKRASVATLRNEGHAGPRSLTGHRPNGPSPLSLDKNANVEPSPYSWNSQNSNDGLLNSSPAYDRPPAVPRHGSPLAYKSGRQSDIIEDEDATLLRDSLAASNLLTNPSKSNSLQPGRYRRNEDTSFTAWKEKEERMASSSKFDPKSEDDNMFDGNLSLLSRTANRYVSRAPSPPRNKVMTPAQFEKYRQEKERQGKLKTTAKSPTESKDENDDEEDHYEEDEDDLEKSKQAAKQRKKQEAHMAVYRQQMMKVTGEAANPGPSRPSLGPSMSTPNLPSLVATPPAAGSDGSEEDEEVPLAILAAHGFPTKNKPPNRLSSMGSNPNLRASVQVPPSQSARPSSSMGDAPARPTSHLPAFAKNLPQDPFLGAGLVNGGQRESMHFGGGAPAPMASQAPVPPGGLVGVIANEERSRAMRRGSPQVDLNQNMMGNPTGFQQAAMFDPISGIPPQMMYGNMPPQMPMMPMMPGMLTPGDQAQIQMTQQMQQFMQMQMQFMQMMAQQSGAVARPNGHLASNSMGDMLSSRHSFVGGPGMDQMLEPPRLDNRMRTMSMVQPSSASWIQPQPGYAPSIRAQGAGYAPSIAPSERSNIGLPGRYRPVSHIAPPMPHDSMRRVSTMSGALGGWDEPKGPTPPPHANGKVSPANNGKSGSNSDDDDEEGWEAMKAKREKKRSLWKSKKSLGSELRAMMS